MFSSNLFIPFSIFLINIPLGNFRAQYPKFSFQWWGWFYAGVFLLIFLSLFFKIKMLYLPFNFAAMMTGQLLGDLGKRKQMTLEDHETMEQISNLRLPDPRPAVCDSEIMVALLNMGGPKTNGEVRGFLKRIFCDELIIRFPFAFILQPLFAKLIVFLRGKATEHRYQLIGGGSPIFNSTLKQTNAVRAELKKRGREAAVTFSFNYSEPYPEDTIAEIKKAGKKYILPISLYPHYSKATTGSNLHHLKKAASRIYPEVNFLEPKSYYLHDAYISAFLDRIQESTNGESLEDFYLLFSAHGLPLYFLAEGDPYPFEIVQSVTKILDRLNRKDNWTLSYQSAVGPMQWLKPSMEEMLKALARRGVKKIIIVPISFVTDHIETLCEIDIEYRALAEKAGILDFRMTRALECHPGFITAVVDCIEASLADSLKNERELISRGHKF